MVYADIVLWAVFGPVALVALIFTVRAAIGWAGLRREADEDFDYRIAHEMMPPGTTRPHFVASYRRVNGPRAATYTATALWTALLTTPVIAIIMEVLLDLLWRATGRSRVFEPGYLVWAFFIFFGLMGAWALIGYLFARRYHAHAPGRLDEELRRPTDQSAMTSSIE